MVGWMTYGNRKFENLDATMRQLIPQLQKTMLELVPMVDADTNAFNEYMVCSFKCPSLVFYPPPINVYLFDRASLKDLSTIFTINSFPLHLV